MPCLAVRVVCGISLELINTGAGDAMAVESMERVPATAKNLESRIARIGDLKSDGGRVWDERGRKGVRLSKRRGKGSKEERRGKGRTIFGMRERKGRVHT